MKYSNLDALLQGDENAKKYFDSLPDYAREQIRSRSGSVNSFESLKDYAENVTRGDN